MNIGDIFECEILSQGINGEGVARIDNFVVFVPFALPNEKAKIEIVSVKKSFANAKLCGFFEIIPHLPFCLSLFEFLPCSDKMLLEIE